MKSFCLVIGLIVLGALSRLLPHPPNFSPIAGMGLFAAIHLPKRWMAYAVPMTALFLSDALIGFHSGMPVIYGLFALIVTLGLIAGKDSASRILGLSLISSIIFFVGSNLAVWISSGMYSQTGAGLVECFTLALPFLHWTVLGDLFFCGLLFGAYNFHVKNEIAQAK